MSVQYHVRMTPSALNRSDALIMSLVQSLFPGVKATDMNFAIDGIEKHRVTTLETLQRRTGREGVNALRAAQGIEPMSDKEYDTWLDLQKLELGVQNVSPGRTLLTFKLIGPAADNTQGTAINAGFENVHDFMLVSYLDGVTKKIHLYVDDKNAIARTFSEQDVAFSPLPFLHFHYGMPKVKKDILDLNQVIGEVKSFFEEQVAVAVRRIPGFENAVHVGANIETCLAVLDEYTANLKHWLVVPDTPLHFDLQSAIIPLAKNKWKLIFVALFQIDSYYMVPLPAHVLTINDDGTTVQMSNYYE